MALAMYAGSKVVLALRVALAGPTVARLSARYASSLMPAVVNIGRTAGAGFLPIPFYPSGVLPSLT